MPRINISTESVATIKAIASNPNFTSKELYKAESDGHQFSIGDVCTLVGLVDFPEFNGQQVKITAIRQDGSHGKAYYVEGEINEFINWVYEYRLVKAACDASPKAKGSGVGA